MTAQDNEQLRFEVEKVFGQKITDKPASERLSEKIRIAINESLSGQSIRRFWQLVPGNDLSTYSKNILCRYAGYNDWNDFSANTFSKNEPFNWHVIKPFYHNVNNPKQLENAAYWYEKMGRSFASFILTNETIFTSFAQEMHQSEVAMKYVISFHPMYDNLGKDWYFRGFRLFLRHADISHYKVFGNAVEGMRCVLTNQPQGLKKYLSNIEALLPAMRKEYSVIWPLEARVFGLMMIDAKYRKDDPTVTELKEECFALLKKYKDKRFEIDNYEIFVFILSDFLNIFDMADIAYELQQQHPLRFTQNVAWKDGYNTAAIVVSAMTLFLNGKKQKAKSLLNTVDLDTLNFDFKQYFSIQYYLLQAGLAESIRNKRRQQQAEEVINQTGLIRLKAIMG